MNRRRFLALLGSTAVAPALPGIGAVPLAFEPEFVGGPAWGTSYIEKFAADQAAINVWWRSAMDAMAYGTGVMRVGADHAEHIPLPDFEAAKV